MKSTPDVSLGNHLHPSGDAETAWLISADKLAQLLEVSLRTLWRLRSAGKLPPPIRIGGCVRWRMQEVRAWIEDGCPTPAHQSLRRSR